MRLRLVDISLRGIASLLLACGAGAQTTLLVPSQYPTIQAAIQASADGDTVLVSPGTYFENIDFLGKAIVVRSVAGPSITIIDANRAGRVATFDSGEPVTATLTGFTLRNGLSGGGAGIVIEGGASATIAGNVLTQNEACGAGSAIAILGPTAPLIVGNLITNNPGTPGFPCSGGQGGGIYIAGSSNAQILHNVVSNNHFFAGGGIALLNAGTPLIFGNEIVGNSAFVSGGIGMSGGSARIIQNLVVGNHSDTFGGGIAWSSPTGSGGPILANNTVDGNTANGGPALYADGFNGPAWIANNIFRSAGTLPPVLATAFLPGAVNFQNNDVLNGVGTNPYGGACPNLTGTAGNLSADPLFVDSSLGDYHLQPGSSCADAGANGVPNSPLADPDGDARAYDGDANGVATIDIGWDELAPVARFGTGCPGGSGVLPRIGLTGPPPALGNSGFGVLLSAAPGGTTAVLVIGLPPAPAPIGLSALGLPACSLLVTPGICLVSTSPGSGLVGGAGTTPMPIPSEPALQGLHLQFQAYAADSPSGLVPGGMSSAADVPIP